MTHAASTAPLSLLGLALLLGTAAPPAQALDPKRAPEAQTALASPPPLWAGARGSRRGADSASAAASRPAVSCPAPPGPARPRGAAVDDILGVRPGLSYDEALALVACSDPQLNVKEDNGRASRAPTYGLPIRTGFQARLVRADRQSAVAAFVPPVGLDTGVGADLLPGEVRWLVAAFGVPGKEKALHVVRRERYGADKSPAMDVVEAALKAKYGVPSSVKRPDTVVAGQQYVAKYVWAFSPEGAPLAAAQLFSSSCAGMPMGPDAAYQYVQGCGVVVAANVRSVGSNAGLAESLDISTVNLHAANRFMSETQDALSSMDTLRANKEVEEARRLVPAPKL